MPALAGSPEIAEEVESADHVVYYNLSRGSRRSASKSLGHEAARGALVKVITDSGSDLPPETAEAADITVVPLTVRFGEKNFTDGVDLTREQFWQQMRDSRDLPETAAPAPGQFAKAFQDAIDNGARGIVCVNLSSKLSGTHQAALAAAREFGDVPPIHVVDSRAVSLGQGLMAIAASRLSTEGRSTRECAAAVKALVPRTRIYAAIDNMENLKKGGRVSAAQAFFGSMLSMKPVVGIVEGKVEPLARPRTRGRSLQYLADKVAEAGRVENLTVVHGEAPDYEDLIDLLDAHYPSGNIIIGNVGPTIATHGGPGVIGVTFQVPTIAST
jgi:DegV family protein with EDD domain